MNKLLARARYAVFIPALASILGALLLMFQGSVAMVVTIIDVVPFKDLYLNLSERACSKSRVWLA